MASLDLQSAIGIFTIVCMIAGLHYRESLCCVCINTMNRRWRVQDFELDSSPV
ncbi:hypothetical protein IQ06DRAFT_297300 [Phaeosphaeriaceae sp. SRC1lsM3a]|nr:hypothetical protein IQ06DRAFT_297300 [Stagonospora sp. SRC1lsM3a]